MINKIIDYICISINSEFGENYKIYTEDVGQGLIEPCFLITCLNPTNDLFRDKKYFNQNQLCIKYFPSTNEINSECNSVLTRLFDFLEYIGEKDNQIMGTKMKGGMIDGVLNFFINYDMFVYKMEEKTPMGELERTQTNVKG